MPSTWSHNARNPSNASSSARTASTGLTTPENTAPGSTPYNRCNNGNNRGWKRATHSGPPLFRRSPVNGSTPAFAPKYTFVN
ncbi:hypothetical protein GCM10017779_72190 [Streptomyces capillispiralis]|nr:hypothetical protein GCM10017779_72190 [Streptomyces capillispiralis]